jgi:hypothetical protein
MVFRVFALWLLKTLAKELEVAIILEWQVLDNHIWSKLKYDEVLFAIFLWQTLWETVEII